MSKDSATMMLSLMSTDTPERVFSRCPIYRRLTAAQRRELVLRGPKGVVNFRSYAWSLMYQGIEAYVKFEPGGVSPVTALALLCPEPRIERRFGALSDAVVIPESIRHPRKSFASSRRRETPFWAVIVWALKRYAAMSWNDVNGLSNDLKRGSTSFRQTVRLGVEEPLAAFYRQLVDEDLAPESYQASIQDRPNSPSWERERMRALKRSARTSRSNPTE
jgi:hypothetical protein